jgi:multidrug efflux pump subunit AcrA (membrane-fusion protein)
MKKYVMAIILIIVLVGSYIGYKTFNPPKPERKILYYQSGMHPWIKSDKPGKCPICGMDLMPVYEEKADKHKEDHNFVKLSSKQLENINVRTEVVRKLPLFKEIRTVGVVAYDPELVVAQEEYIAALEAGNLVNASRRKLQILGLSQSEIRRLERTRKADTNLLLPEKKMWVYADIYEEELAWVKAGDRVKIVSVAYPGREFTGQVRSIEPILDAKTRSAKLRIDTYNPGLRLKPQMYVDVYLKSKPRYSLAIPKNALLDTGERKVVYVEKEKGIYEPKQVKTGPVAEVMIDGVKQKYLSVLRGLIKGEKVVTSANFLIDSQSQLTGGSSALYGGAKELEQNHGR